MSIIYQTINLINGKYYVGQHYTSADDGYLGSGKFLKNSIRKNGHENFKREILEHCTSANINEREIFWIAELSATNQNIGYNISVGGTGALAGKDNINYKMSEEQLKIRALKTANTIKKYGLLKGENHPLYNKGHTKEAKDKIKNNHYNCKGENNSRAKNWIVISPDNQQYYIKGTLKNFCKEHNISYSIMIRHLNKGIIKKSKLLYMIGWELKNI